MNSRDDEPSPFIPVRDLKMDPGAEDLLESPTMQPYLRLALAVTRKEKLRPALEEISALPLENRYVWRVASALKWAFTDFDAGSVAADRETLRPEDGQALAELLKMRPVQFCLFLEVLYGNEQMESIMSSAVAQVKKLRSKRVQEHETEHE